ncbi:hypothetical protein PXK00_07495 [Phaeobacter sp. QD34_3]|uniref:hypothetical protein n=1 Tax=unclassified Phaeobacter TaxID=2621772 RepID=UPI00237F737E|nr:MULTISPECIES: hypothetical protein [unclassified Phaeobacter]MDE4132949.1 hypothetical protein [Phaeobacter sp. QD34_3]MDE4136649.1 hypothetical protein [Phaeobacter sp. QD34_24]MDE4174165.1 hypothetical protein [Phaeobacter sp. PT47_59]
MRVPTIAVSLLLMGCAAPSTHFQGIEPVRVTVEGSSFDLRQRGTLIEAVRINPEYAPRLGPLRDRARRAMAASSGCRVRWVMGDQALLLGRLDCRDRL